MKEKSRNYGIDLLRIIAMLCVVILHAMNSGGLLFYTIKDSSQYKFAWLIEIIAFCAVDVFAIISGYVMWNKKTNYKKLINLWFQVVFYSLIITFVTSFIYPNSVYKSDYIKSVFPVINKTYWYFTAYFGLFIIKPFIDKGIQDINEKTLKKIFIIILVIFSLFGIITKGFELNNGYSIIWLIILYITGAIINKCNIGSKLKNIHILLGIIILITITYLFKIFGFDTINTIKKSFDIVINKDTLINYVSPTIFGIAILLIIGLSRLEINNKSKKIIEFASSSTFAIYLLNSHRFVDEIYMKKRFTYLIDDSIFTIFITIIGYAIIFVILAILIDKIRIYLFKKLKIDNFSSWIYLKINILINKISTKL